MPDSSQSCKWIHQKLDSLKRIRFPFDLETLPRNGIYFFYEKGESWGHGGNNPRIVRIGTSRDGNFRSRIDEHFLLKNEQSRMDFGIDKPAPHERSIFRKNIGRALLKMRGDDAYLRIWNKDFTTHQARAEYGNERDIDKEKSLETEITMTLRRSFEFRYLIVNVQAERMNSSGLESKLIGTVAHCGMCRPSDQWLGRYSPIDKIRMSGLWLVQHLGSSPITEADKARISYLSSQSYSIAIATMSWSTQFAAVTDDRTESQ